MRTLQTTEPIHESTGLVPEVWVELHEQGGCMQGPSPEVMVGRSGMTGEEIREKFPAFRVADEIDGQGWWKSQPYEPPEQARLRADRLARLTREQFAGSSERVAYVMHRDFKLLLIESLCPDPERQPIVHNTSVSKLTLTSQGTSVEYFNRVDHLPEELITH